MMKQQDIGERISVFAESLHAEESPELRALEREALENNIPIIRPQTRGLIQCILEMTAPSRILEVGTAVGYSALVMDTYAPCACSITTIERDAQRAAQARKNFERFYPEGDNLNGSIKYVDTAVEALKDADICFIMTEWSEIKKLKAEDFTGNMKSAVVYDGRNLYEPEDMKNAGIEYYCIGR